MIPVSDLSSHRLNGQLLTRTAAQAQGKSQRELAPRQSLSVVPPRPADWRLFKAWQAENQHRIASSVPIRARRMAGSAFGFYRGWPALMASDLVNAPHSGLALTICGDCHVMNFGGFASPERQLIYGINDFDESVMGPFEWDLKRLATSVRIAIKDLKGSASQQSEAVTQLVQSYVERLKQLQPRSPLGQWYDLLTREDVLALFSTEKAREKLAKAFDKAANRPDTWTSDRLTETDPHTGKRRFREEGPLQTHSGQPGWSREQVEVVLQRYQSTLQPDRQQLFQRYALSDWVYRITGVGSVGMPAALILLESGDSEPLILQLKAAQAPALGGIAGSFHTHQGERVVSGQRLLQAASDIFLGWTELPTEGQQTVPASQTASHAYLRQFRDKKVSLDLEEMTPEFLIQYSGVCGVVLAHAHAKSGDADVLLGYVGEGESFAEAMAEFAAAAEQRNLQDYQVFLQEIQNNNIKLAPQDLA